MQTENPMDVNANNEAIVEQTHPQTSASPNETNAKSHEYIKPPPPIMVKNVQKFSDFRKFLLLIEGIQFSLKSTLTGITVKPQNPLSYRTIVKALKDGGYFYYTYSLTEDKPFRVVLKNLHSSTEVTEIDLILFFIHLFKIIFSFRIQIF